MNDGMPQRPARTSQRGLYRADAPQPCPPPQPDRRDASRLVFSQARPLPDAERLIVGEARLSSGERFVRITTIGSTRTTQIYVAPIDGPVIAAAITDVRQRAQTSKRGIHFMGSLTPSRSGMAIRVLSRCIDRGQHDVASAVGLQLANEHGEGRGGTTWLGDDELDALERACAWLADSEEKNG